jgi:hypothetical protein
MSSAASANPNPSPEEALQQFETENAADIAAEPDKRFEMTDATADEQAESSADAITAPPEEKERLSKLQKINRMTVAERVKLAVLGDKEDRMILVRDGSKVVNGAVLASPKISDQEIETIAAMKNVQENVLRTLARNRKFIKSYAVEKSLLNNPRCPLDNSLALMKNLLVPDLKGLSMNKNFPETLKKLATKQYKEKTAPPGQKGQ